MGFQEFRNKIKVGFRNNFLVTKFVFELLDVLKCTRFEAD